MFDILSFAEYSGAAIKRNSVSEKSNGFEYKLHEKVTYCILF